MDSTGVAERVWYGEGVIAGATRAALSPCAVLYGAGVALRGALYDAGVLQSRPLTLPALSVGNLTVGGTGKTPAAAWFAAQLAARGARPAIVLRGYGGDEPLVHRELNRDITVIVSPDRVAGVARAAALGADLAVLDDAFQHRRARRDADVVVINADRWATPRRLLPAGPWREPLSALRRATLALVTRRAVSPVVAAAVVAELVRRVPGLPVAVVSLALGELRSVGENGTQPLAVLAGAHVFAAAGIGDPRALRAQLLAAGSTVTMRAFGDHHRFTASDISAIVSRAGRADWIVCTLKDAVKLRPLWTRALPPLWYVSQQFVVESGERAIDATLAALLGARSDHPERTGRTVHQPPTHS